MNDPVVQGQSTVSNGGDDLVAADRCERETEHRDDRVDKTHDTVVIC